MDRVTPGASGDRNAEPDPGCRVAVIIPCFNDGATLGEAVESLQAQENCEVVIVDDGSDDPETLAQLERLRAAGVRVIRQENLGLPRARMRGLADTSARYVFALDADDRLMPGALTKLAARLDEDPRLGVAWGDLRLFGDVELRQPRRGRLDPWLISHVNSLAPALIRREALTQVGGWVLDVGYEDWDLWMGLAEHGWQGIGIGDETYCYRIASTRMLGRARNQHEGLFIQMRDRHPELFRRRRSNWRRSDAPLRVRLLVPLVASAPLPLLLRHRLSMAILEPGHGLRSRRSRRQQAA